MHISSGLLSTQDVDLLMDSRFSLRLIGKNASQKGLIGILKKVAHSFEPLAKNSYRPPTAMAFLSI
ncbi:MAG: GSU2403 family nucleotidyltransferase fold protein [Phyllobacterium sp.]|uniref:GSU2403 family nucleotidyltransferase fold protein n=1 Tax=Phyllobacterium sp. TaxID=1871046 RepID=UPI0030F1E07B